MHPLVAVLVFPGSNDDRDAALAREVDQTFERYRKLCTTGQHRASRSLRCFETFAHREV